MAKQHQLRLLNAISLQQHLTSPPKISDCTFPETMQVLILPISFFRFLALVRHGIKVKKANNNHNHKISSPTIGLGVPHRHLQISHLPQRNYPNYFQRIHSNKSRRSARSRYSRRLLTTDPRLGSCDPIPSTPTRIG